MGNDIDDAGDGDDIVLVDDDPMVAEFVRRVLRGSDRRLLAFVDPERALEHLTGRSPRVLLVDSRMPKMEGAEFLARLAGRNHRGGHRVFLSSAGPIEASAWLERMPAHVEIVSKDALLDRHTLPERLGSDAPPR